MTNNILLGKLGLSSPTEAVEVLHHLVVQNTLTREDIKQALQHTQESPSSTENSSGDAVSMEKVASSTTHTSNDHVNNDKNSTTSNKKSNKTTTADENSTKLKNKNNKNERKYIERHIALRFHYDGASYSGLAQNMNSPTDNSVERVLFAALEKTCLIKSRQDCGYSRCGRTDKGVSAFGQVVALRVSSSFPVGTSIQTTNQGSSQQTTDGDASDNNGIVSEDSLEIMNQNDLPRNSIERITCFVPPKPSKQKRNKKRDRQSSQISSTENMNNNLKNDNSESPTKLVPATLTEKNFPQILNGVLPPTIRVLGWSPVSNEFSARFSASSRTYRYFFIKRDLDLDAMKKGLAYMVGRHDFRNLCKMNCEEVDNFERVIIEANIVIPDVDKTLSCLTTSSLKGGDDNGESPMVENDHNNDDNGNGICNYRQPCYFEIKGQAFLWHQIRCIASILFMIGQGDESPSIVQELLDIKKNPGKPAYPFANDLPLVLHWCGYANLKFGHSVLNLWRVSCDLESKWEDLTLAAERIRNGLNSLQDEAYVQKEDVESFINNALSEQRRKLEKLSRSHQGLIPHKDLSMDIDPGSVDFENSPEIMSWADALFYIKQILLMKPSPDGPQFTIHTPLMQRSRGTTLEEKVKSIMSDPLTQTPGNECTNDRNVTSKRRRERYQENIIKKKVAREEDDKFYQNMLSQGGSGV